MPRKNPLLTDYAAATKFTDLEKFADKTALKLADINLSKPTDNPNIYRVIYDESDDISDEMFTNHKAKRSRRAFKIKEPRFQFNKDVAIAVLVTIVVCGVIYLLAF